MGSPPLRGVYDRWYHRPDPDRGQRHKLNVHGGTKFAQCAANSAVLQAFRFAMAIAVEPTFHCVAVKKASEMGPHPEPRLRAAVRRRRAERQVGRPVRAERRGLRAARAERRALRPVRAERRRVLVIGDRRTHMDQAAVVATVAFAAVALGFVAARL